MDIDNPQPNYKGPPQCFKGFHQPIPLSCCVFFEISKETRLNMLDSDKELKKYRILMSKVIF